MIKEQLESILHEDAESYSNETTPTTVKCKILLGLNLIAKYLPNSGIDAATHDIVYACSVSDLAETTISEDEVIQLLIWGWMEDEDSLACFI